MSRIHKIRRIRPSGIRIRFKYIPLILLVYLIAEISLLIWVGRRFGALNTILLLAVCAVIGLWLVMKQGVSLFKAIWRELSEHRLPGLPLLDGFVRIIGGILIAIPGFISDAAGLLLLVPAVRRGLLRRLNGWLRNQFKGGIWYFDDFRR
ncbi:FxsA family protein [Sporolactobacillus vineae]|uniref:FxsA family protein n=1 Tax=Sporolactobacillus vineae TaxID=444463 RepID=UPI00028991E7|nr:FxsA family protein [Sporolactobacillus vineae]